MVLIICQSTPWSLARLSWMKSQERAQGRLRTQQKKRWKGKVGLPLQPGFFVLPPKNQPYFCLHENLLGCCRQIWTCYKYKVFCSQLSLTSPLLQIQPKIKWGRPAQIVWTHFQIYKFCDLAGSICPMEVYIQFSEKVSPWLKWQSCKKDLLHMVVLQGLVSSVLSVWYDGIVRLDSLLYSPSNVRSEGQMDFCFLPSNSA